MATRPIPLLVAVLFAASPGVTGAARVLERYDVDSLSAMAKRLFQNRNSAARRLLA